MAMSLRWLQRLPSRTNCSCRALILVALSNMINYKMDPNGVVSNKNRGQSRYKQECRDFWGCKRLKWWSPVDQCFVMFFQGNQSTSQTSCVAFILLPTWMMIPRLRPPPSDKQLWAYCIAVALERWPKPSETLKMIQNDGCWFIDGVLYTRHACMHPSIHPPIHSTYYVHIRLYNCAIVWCLCCIIHYIYTYLYIYICMHTQGILSYMLLSWHLGDHHNPIAKIPIRHIYLRLLRA